ncbi:hypothetical protein PSN45_002748 [Yamadazyma tenuis]|uniref:Uncharacterized protein n=1 Tax=Candida tenuis (strain ATCC 10573 / BCRC 21748 / CBS 615 / JCM 9827 / NBRC 10315 / NRRL Y-1498 / VKM Y-70) TaxID=590646 RepID=G3AWX1_CANTC|nr:uncharacterized protein CANTEDRAFT_91809 [Yamadazyma tenuis ATCC 10573]EGV66640.1 hypothetical protein CANTEDRAFT_91809 [Yamadazyma tenuis ATCC 10573]WEJ95235.1 hypothetical protein PSN45_002748 [Yamadazyma tenuis]
MDYSDHTFARPPLPSDFSYFSPMTLQRSNPSDKSDPLQRLEVETTSTTSVPISFPYYYIDENNNSFDTFNLLNDGTNSQEAPKYTNTTHNIQTEQNATVGGLQVKKGTASSDSHTKLKQLSDEAFNPVPSRFSQFITEQQQADDLSSNTTSIGSYSDGPIPRSRKGKSYSTTMSKNKMSSSISQGRASKDLRREISQSMESQATIFSTRQDEQPPSTSKTVYRTSSSASTLSRRKAIRFKEGSFIYRMRLRLKKLLKKFKQLKFKIPVSSKRTGNNSIKRSRTKGRTLKRKFRANPKNKAARRFMNISAPINNPSLGRGNATKVNGLDDGLKYEAGAPKENVNMGSRDMKMNHLSSYIDQQQGLYLNNMDQKSESMNYGRTPSIAANTNINTIDGIEEIPVSEYSSIPPPVPKHGNPQTVLGSYDDLISLWRRYLAHVVSKRIQLRQEITYFQEMLVGQELKSGKTSTQSRLSSIYNIDEGDDEYDDEEEEDYEDNELVSDTVSETGTIESSSYVTTSLSSKSEAYSEQQMIKSYIPDATSEKFNRKFNRQSVLSEMLDYESSDSESSTTTSISDQTSPSYKSTLKYTNSSTQASLEIGRQYSIKKKPLIRSLSSMSSHHRGNSPMRRSVGYQMELNMAH